MGGVLDAQVAPVPVQRPLRHLPDGRSRPAGVDVQEPSRHGRHFHAEEGPRVRLVVVQHAGRHLAPPDRRPPRRSVSRSPAERRLTAQYGPLSKLIYCE